MSNLQLYFAVGLPTFAILTSLVVSMFQISAIREDMREIRADIKAIVGKLGAMDVELGKLMDKL